MTGLPGTTFGGTAFLVWRNDDGSVPYWSSSPVYADMHIAGGSRVVTQVGGFGLENLSFPVILASMADYAALKALETTSGTLGHYPSPGYEDFPGVLLRDAGQPSPYVTDNMFRVRTTLTFSRRRPA